MDKLSLYQTAYTKYPYTLPPLKYAFNASSRTSTNKPCICIMTSIIRLISTMPTKRSANILRCRKAI